MSRCRDDTRGVLDLSLSTIGLYIATGILFAIVASFIVSNEWHTYDELHALASSFSNLLLDVDNTFFENTTLLQFPQQNYLYRVLLSTEYIRITAKGGWGNDLAVTRQLVIRPWVRYLNQNWTTGADLHEYLNTAYGHHGTQHDSISSRNLSSLIHEQNMSVSYSAVHPLEINQNAPVYIEKVTIYYDGGNKHDFVLVYQVP
jgi:hypothetical protein